MPAEPGLRVLVLGGAGQLGTELAALSRPDLAVSALARAVVDVTDGAAVEAVLSALKPDLVVNAAAFTAVDRAEAEPERAAAVNRDGAARVAAACARRRVGLIHVSTDYVFSGAAPYPYAEDAVPDPINAYGAGKAAGEALARDAHARVAVLRTSWLFGPRGPSFVHAILRQAARGGPLRVVADQVGRPSSATQLAGCALRLAESLAAQGSGWGVFHAIGGPPVTWHGFARAVLRAGHGADAPEVVPIATADWPTPAARPPRAVLGGDRLRAVHGLEPLDWRAALPATARAARAALPRSPAAPVRRVAADSGEAPPAWG